MRISDFPFVQELTDEYIRLRQNGQSRDQALKALITQYQNELTCGARDDGLLFWIGLADAQYALKELSKEVSVQGLAALDHLSSHIPEIAETDINRRRRHYACAPMPERAQVRKPRRFRCQWNIGDTFAYRLSGQDAEKHGLTGTYILLRVVDMVEFDGGLTPIVTLCHWKKMELPTTANEYQQAPLLKLSSGRLGSPKHTYEYRIRILFTSQQQIQRLNLQYLGNFIDVPMPTNEFFDSRPGCALMLLPRSFNEELIYYCGLLCASFQHK